MIVVSFLAGAIGSAAVGPLIEVITHLAFYAGWPKAMTAISVAK